MKLEPVPVSPSNEAVYGALRDMAITFRFPPGQRINEGELAKQLAVSRTPLREAMQKLVSERLLDWRRNKGFFCRPLDAKQSFDLYEFRQSLEAISVRFACERATDAELDELGRFLDDTVDADDERNIDRLLHYDQKFHEGIATLSRNAEILAALRNVNARIYFIRWIAMTGQRERTQAEHRAVVDAMGRRDADEAVDAMVGHIAKRMDEIAGFVREGYGRIYTGLTPDRQGKPS